MKRILTAMTLLSLASPCLADFAEKVNFNRDVLPILSTNCFPCHGPDTSKRKADLRLDDRESAVSKRDGQPAIVPGRPNESELIARTTSKDVVGRMPPLKSGYSLSFEQIQLLRPLSGIASEQHASSPTGFAPAPLESLSIVKRARRPFKRSYQRRD